MTKSRFGSGQFPSHWRLSMMDVELYSSQKSIAIDCGDDTGAALDQGAPDDVVANVWQNVYRPRLDSLNRLNRHRAHTPIVFPGRSSALAHLQAAENFAFERFRTFVQHKLLASSEIGSLDDDSRLEARSWQWKTIPAPTLKRLRQLTARQLGYQFEQEIGLLSQDCSQAQLLSVFDSIHAAWSSLPHTDYDKHALSLALNYAHTAPENLTVAILFELEEFVSYCSLLQTLNVVASGIYAGKWIDIAAKTPGELRATEKCWPARLLQEMQNLASGRTAPLIVNELSCVCDGNHRLGAVWIWNMLHTCPDVLWQTGNPLFEARLSTFFNKHRNERTHVALVNALEGLSSLLNLEESAQALLSLSTEIAAKQVEILPVVPMPSYNKFALDLIAFESEGQFNRFDPQYYWILQAQCDTFLPARACYHFADRVAMPWFSVLSKSAKMEQNAACGSQNLLAAVCR